MLTASRSVPAIVVKSLIRPTHDLLDDLERLPQSQRTRSGPVKSHTQNIHPSLVSLDRAAADVVYQCVSLLAAAPEVEKVE